MARSVFSYGIPGWKNGEATCKMCGYAWRTSVAENTDRSMISCPKCSSTDCKFEEDKEEEPGER